jgi:hypothetical protein
MATIKVLDALGAQQDVELPLTTGRKSAALSRPVALSDEDFALLDNLEAEIGGLTETAPGTDTASSGLNGRLQRIAQRLTSLIAAIPTALGQTTKSASLAVTIASDDDIQGKLGSLTETAPASDTASSGLNGRLQRVAQRVTSLIGLFPAALGANGGLKVDIVGGSSSGTQYTEDAAAAADPIGNMLIAVRRDTLSTSEVSADGDNIALKATNKGQLHIFSDSIGAVGGAAYDGTNNVNLFGFNRAMADAALSTAPSSVKIDQTTDGTTNKIAVGNSPAANTAKTYTGTFVVAGTTLTRPANTTAYSIGDSISDNATAASVTAKSTNNLSDTNDHPIDLVEVLLDTTDIGPGTAGATIRLHLYNSDPTASSGVVGGDNAAFSNKKAGWIGSFSGTMRPFSDGSKGVLIPDEGSLRMIAPASGAKNLWYQLEARTAFTPSANSTTFTPTFKGFQARAA